MEILGVTTDDIRARHKEEFELMFPDPEDQQKCYDHFENRRQKHIQDIIQKREEVINETAEQKK